MVFDHASMSYLTCSLSTSLYVLGHVISKLYLETHVYTNLCFWLRKYLYFINIEEAVLKTFESLENIVGM